MKHLWTAALILTVFACSDDGDDNKSAADAASAPMCIDDPDLTIDGQALPLSALEFRNAFDPNDATVYDPDNVAALPGPVMVDVWGSRAAAAHGTLGVFPPGFSAPLHTHTNDYYGVVLRGEMTNPFGTDLDVFLDDDDANNHGSKVLGAGSFWYVPAGSQHTTTCRGPEVCWFYFHSERLFDFAPIVDDMGDLLAGVTLETPHADAVLTAKDELNFAGEPGSFVQFAGAWGDMTAAAHGTFGLFNAGAASPVHVHSDDYYGVVIEGTVTNPFNLAATPPELTTGGYWQVPADSVHVTACADGTPCLFYFHARNAFDFTPVCEE